MQTLVMLPGNGVNALRGLSVAIVHSKAHIIQCLAGALNYAARDNANNRARV